MKLKGFVGPFTILEYFKLNLGFLQRSVHENKMNLEIWKTICHLQTAFWQHIFIPVQADSNIVVVNPFITTENVKKPAQIVS